MANQLRFVGSPSVLMGSDGIWVVHPFRRQSFPLVIQIVDAEEPISSPAMAPQWNHTKTDP